MSQEQVLEEQTTFDPRRYLAILKTRKWTVVTCVALSVLASLFISARQTPLYTAEAQILLKANPTAGTLPSAENEAAAVLSNGVASMVIEDLNLDTTAHQLLGSASAAPQSATADLVLITFTSSDPAVAQDVANAFARNYIQYRTNQSAEQVDEQIRDLEGRIATLQTQVARVVAQIETARRDGNTTKAAQLDTERSVLAARLGVLEQRLDDLEQQGVTTPGAQIAEILKPAALPSSPSSPNHSRNAFLGLLLGMTLGVGAAFLRERLDDRFRGRPDVERALGSPVLATVPKFTTTKRAGTAQLPSLEDPRGAASEAYRNLRTGVQFIASQRAAKTFLVTSPGAHEGKTSTSANLGIVLSQTGRRVVLVSADLRRPQLEKTFGAGADAGLSTWLLGETDEIAGLLLEHPQIPDLNLLPAGPVPSNPAELLTSPRLAQLTAELRDRFDFVIFDSPPVLPVADAVIIASQVDAIMLVVDAASTSRSAAVHAKEQIERVGGHIVGCVLNAFDASSTPYYYEPYYYSDYGSSDEGDQEQEPRNARAHLREVGRRFSGD